MSKLSTLSLAELYAKPKITPAVQREILLKEDFTKISENYCSSVCRLKCKNTKFASQSLSVGSESGIDILIIQDHIAPRGRFDRSDTQQEEIQTGVIKEMCTRADFSGLRYNMVNLLKCPPNAQDFPLGKSPIQTTLLKCSPYLIEEIKALKPKVIISLGTATTKALGLSKHSNTRNRGEIVNSEYGPVVITMHPKILSMIRQNATGAGGMWGADYFDVILRDFKKASSLARGNLKLLERTKAIEFYKDNRIILAKSLDDVKAIMAKINSLPHGHIVSFDTETTGLDPHHPSMRLLTIQFGWRDPATSEIVAAVIPLWHRENTHYNPDEAWVYVASFLSGPQPKVAHNAKYDILVIWCTKKVRVRNLVFDTMLALHSISSGCQGTYGLKTATWDFVPELGFAGYEDLLGSLADLQKEDDANNMDEEVGVTCE